MTNIHLFLTRAKPTRRNRELRGTKVAGYFAPPFGKSGLNTPLPSQFCKGQTSLKLPSNYAQSERERATPVRKVRE
jgi:hypothetical protein